MTAVLGWRDVLRFRGQLGKRASVSREAGRASPRGEAAAKGCSRRESAGKSRVAVSERFWISRRAGGNPKRASDQLSRLGREAETVYYGGGEADGGRGLGAGVGRLWGGRHARGERGTRSERCVTAAASPTASPAEQAGIVVGRAPPKSTERLREASCSGPQTRRLWPVHKAGRDSARESVLRIGQVGPHDVKPLGLHAVAHGLRR